MKLRKKKKKVQKAVRVFKGDIFMKIYFKSRNHLKLFMQYGLTKDIKKVWIL